MEFSSHEQVAVDRENRTNDAVQARRSFLTHSPGRTLNQAVERKNFSLHTQRYCAFAGSSPARNGRKARSARPCPKQTPPVPALVARSKKRIDVPAMIRRSNALLARSALSRSRSTLCNTEAGLLHGKLPRSRPSSRISEVWRRLSMPRTTKNLRCCMCDWSALSIKSSNFVRNCRKRKVWRHPYTETRLHFLFLCRCVVFIPL